MEMVVNDKAVMAGADATTAACYQEDLEHAIVESMATVITSESASGAAEVAGGRYLEDLDHTALEGIALVAMARYKVVVILSDKE
jgi:hypothetical protein